MMSKTGSRWLVFSCEDPSLLKHIVRRTWRAHHVTQQMAQEEQISVPAWVAPELIRPTSWSGTTAE